MSLATILPLYAGLDFLLSIILYVFMWLMLLFLFFGCCNGSNVVENNEMFRDTQFFECYPNIMYNSIICADFSRNTFERMKCNLKIVGRLG